MTQWHSKSGTKVSGGKRMSIRRSDKRLAWKGGEPANTTIILEGDEEAKPERYVAKGLGNTTKTKSRLENYVIATEAGAGKASKHEIVSVVENNADAQFARRNIITRGAVLKVKGHGGSGEAFVKVTSRPGQSGVVSGILIKDFRSAKQEKKETKKAKKPLKTHKKAETSENK